MNNIYRDYKETKQLIEDVCSGDNAEFKNILRRKLYTVADLEQAQMFIKQCEDMGIHRLTN